MTLWRPLGWCRHERLYNIDMLNVRSEGDTVLLPVKVVPGASRTRFLGEWNGRAKVAVAAPAEKGKANEALRTFLAKLLGVRKNDVTVVSGATVSVKTIRIERVTTDTVRAVFESDRS